MSKKVSLLKMIKSYKLKDLHCVHLYIKFNVACEHKNNVIT